MWRAATQLWRESRLAPAPRLARCMAKKSRDSDFVVTPCEVARFCEEALVASGAEKANAREAAHVLVAADYYGHASHGVLRLSWFVNDLCAGRIDGSARPSVVSETPAVALVDGNNGLGHCVSNFCNQLAMQKARGCGVGYVTAKNTNHFGIAAYYTRCAADAGMIGVAMSVSAPFVVPPGAKQALLGTNPISVAAPGCDGDLFVFDSATSNSSFGKIQEMAAKKKKIPPDWALGKKGKTTTDPAEALDAKMLLPLGGVPGGHKGYGLALTVDLLTSVLAGAASGPQIPDAQWKEPGGSSTPACLGASFLVLDPAAFGDGFRKRLSDLLNAMRCTEPLVSSNPVRAPGDRAKKHAAECDARGGICYGLHQRAAMDAIVKRLKICPIRPS